MIQELFPGNYFNFLFTYGVDFDIMTEHVMKEIAYSDSKRNMTIDIYIPALSLALEYQVGKAKKYCLFQGRATL